VEKIVGIFHFIEYECVDIQIIILYINYGDNGAVAFLFDDFQHVLWFFYKKK
jgi:hypothetical protein